MYHKNRALHHCATTNDIRLLADRISVLENQKKHDVLNENPIFLAGHKAAIEEVIRIVSSYRTSSISRPYNLCVSIIEQLRKIKN